ncbi:hypothetical protein TeGR_g8915 [Tetraparma gracilis]|uniref:GATA-type domain-containing protein n=1 Tax=Tetraparma gracilis TaxID=2962635 RepID=A0ABQ6MR82_9STRA|nr:hypothetical protein TeGR_g8915 [Tetraparma gracilis]
MGGGGSTYDLGAMGSFGEAFRASLIIELKNWATMNRNPDVVRDTCGDAYLGAPYHAKKKNGLSTLVLNRQFRNLPARTSLDPRERFYREPCSVVAAAKGWITETEGLQLEVQVAHSLGRQRKACLACHKVALRWGGGAGGSWRDVVCGACGALYEVKAKNKVVGIQEGAKVDGGSLWTLLGLKRDVPKFMVIVRRANEAGGEDAHKVFVARHKVGEVGVRFCHKIFSQKGKMSFKTIASLERVQGLGPVLTPWFDMKAREPEMAGWTKVSRWRRDFVTAVFKEVVEGAAEWDWGGVEEGGEEGGGGEGVGGEGVGGEGGGEEGEGGGGLGVGVGWVAEPSVLDGVKVLDSWEDFDDSPDAGTGGGGE